MQVLSKLAAVMLIAVAIFLVWAGVSWWRVNTIECWFDGVLVEPSRCTVTAPLQGQRLLGLDLDTDQWQALRSFTDTDKKTWQLLHWQKRLPQTVVLQFASSPATYVVMLPDSTWWLVNQRGFLQSLTAEQAAQSGLPKITLGAKWPPADYANYQLQIHLHEWLQKLSGEIALVLAPPSQINLVDSFTTEIVWSDWQLVISPLMDLEQLNDQLTQIKLLLSEKNQSLGPDYKKLDLRFKLPVLEPKNPQSQKLFPSLAPKPTATASAALSPTAKPSLKPTVKPTGTPTPTLSPTPTTQVKQ